MKKEYFSPEFDLTRLSFEQMLTNLTDSNGEIGKRDGDDVGLDE